jgi:cytochrome c6
MKNNFSCLFLLCFFWIFFSVKKSEAINLEKGKELFLENCTVCHIGGSNLIIPEKNLNKNSLEANGMNSLNAITYQIINGKNGMPAFGGRLQEEEIEILASYVLKQSFTNFSSLEN